MLAYREVKILVKWVLLGIQFKPFSFTYSWRPEQSLTAPLFNLAMTFRCVSSNTQLPRFHQDHNTEIHLPCINVHMYFKNTIPTYLLRSSHFRTPSLQSLIRSHNSRSESSSPLRNSDVPVPASEAWLAVKAALFKYV
jgi:hypothetical protein